MQDLTNKLFSYTNKHKLIFGNWSFLTPAFNNTSQYILDLSNKKEGTLEIISFGTIDNFSIFSVKFGQEERPIFDTFFLIFVENTMIIRIEVIPSKCKIQPHIIGDIKYWTCVFYCSSIIWLLDKKFDLVGQGKCDYKKITILIPNQPCHPNVFQVKKNDWNQFYPISINYYCNDRNDKSIGLLPN